MSRSMYDKYGGFAAVSRIVLDFYERALDSDDLGPYFEDVDMKKLVDHQTKFIASILGGPASYSDQQLRQIHVHLRVSDEDFDAMAETLEETLRDHGFTHEDAGAAVTEIEARRAFIVA